MKQLIGMLATLFIFVSDASSADNQVTQDAIGNMRLGDPRAPVTVMVWSSMYCGGCQHWHTNVFPWLKSAYIDQGKVLFVFIETEAAPGTLQTNDYWAYMIARCAGPDRYFDVIDTMLRTMSEPQDGPEDRKIIDEAVRNHTDYYTPWRFNAGRRGGLTDQQITDCENDAVAWNAVTTRYNANWEVFHAADPEDKAGETPLFLVNGRILTSADRYTKKGMQKAIEAAAHGN